MKRECFVRHSFFCVAMSVLLCQVAFPANSVLASEPSRVQPWISSKANPEAAVMRPGTPTTPSDSAYLPGYRPSDANDAAAAHATGQVVSSISKSGSIFLGHPLSKGSSKAPLAPFQIQAR